MSPDMLRAAEREAPPLPEGRGRASVSRETRRRRAAEAGISKPRPAAPRDPPSPPATPPASPSRPEAGPLPKLRASASDDARAAALSAEKTGTAKRRRPEVEAARAAEASRVEARAEKRPPSDRKRAVAPEGAAEARQRSRDAAAGATAPPRAATSARAAAPSPEAREREAAAAAAEVAGVGTGFQLSLLLVLAAVIVVVRFPQKPSSLLGQLYGLGALIAFVVSYVYPLRKHLRWFSRFSMAAVLRFHTALTVLGGTLAVLHGGMHLGPNVATAATVVMFALLVSGLFGSYLYVHALRLEDRAAAIRKRISGLVPLPLAGAPEALVEGRRRGGAAGEPSASDRLAPARASAFARFLQLWRVVHGTVSYFFILIVAAHVVAALSYRGNALWSFARDSLRRP